MCVCVLQKLSWDTTDLLNMSETISTSVSAAVIFSAEESWDRPPNRKDILKGTVSSLSLCICCEGRGGFFVVWAELEMPASQSHSGGELRPALSSLGAWKTTEM